MVYCLRSEKRRRMKSNEENDPPQNTTEAKQYILSKENTPKQSETAGGVKKGSLKSSEHFISHSPAKTRSRSSSPHETSTGRITPLSCDTSCRERGHPETLLCDGCVQTNASFVSPRMQPLPCERPWETAALNTELKENISFWDRSRSKLSPVVCARDALTPLKKKRFRNTGGREPFDDISNCGKDDAGVFFLSVPPNSFLLNENEEPSPINFEEKETVLCEDNSSESEEPSPKNSKGKETVLCEGIRSGKNRQLLGFVSKAYRSVSDGLWSVATGNATDVKNEAILSSEALLPPYRGINISKHSDGRFRLASATCDGEVRKNYMRGDVRRCGPCYASDLKLKGHISSDSPWTTRAPSPTLAGEQRGGTKISSIAQNSEAAAIEIRQLRDELKKLRRKRIREHAKNNMKGGNSFQLQDPEQMECASKAIEEANKEVNVSGIFRNDSDSKELWQYHYEQLSKYAKVGGKKKGMQVDPVILNWCIGLLAKTSNSVYRELQRVFLLPDISWVNKKASERVSTSSCTAHGVHARTIASIDESLKNKGEYLGSDQRLGFLSFDSYQLREGMKWDHQKLTYVGGDDQFSYDILDRKFRAMAKDAGDSEASVTDDNASFSCLFYCSPILDNIKLAKHHMVFKWTGLNPHVNISDVVASADITDLKPSTIANLIVATVTCLNMHKLKTVGMAYDSASENVKINQMFAKSKALEWLPTELMEKFPIIDFEYKVGFLDGATKKPFIMLPDMPHLVKCIVNAVERSSRKASNRNMYFGDCPINTGAIMGVWKATGGFSHQQAATKLTMRHFVKDAWSRMNVSLAVQLLSKSTATMLQKCVDDDDVKLPLKNEKYFRLIELCEKVDRLVDI
eukprot:scaffold26127_cov56-Attheya_sp.AAC.1